MAWEPPERPDWVVAVNAGRVVPMSEEASLPLSRDALMGEARARLGMPDGGLADFGGPGFDAEAMLEPLDVLLPSLENEAELSLMGRWLARRFLLRLLEGRLQLMDLLRRDPGVVDETVDEPLFVAGAPRTGTTILHTLLAADPAHRVPEGWELLRPVPPPDPDPERYALDPRIALADRELRMPQTVVSGLLAIHEYGGRKPKECLSSMSFAFRSEEFTARHHVPSYERWLLDCDMKPAYEMHKLVLQVLQRRTSPADWVLKSPVHLHSLPTLLAVYPDARVAITHRDPLALLASLTSLIANLRWAHSDVVDYAEIGHAHVERYATSLGKLAAMTADGLLPEDPLHHSRYAEFMDDAMTVVAGLYDRFGRPLSDAAAKRMGETLAARPQGGEHGRHAYSVDDLGAEPAVLRERFRSYQEQFDVPDEVQIPAR